jgi:hypothetical protein
MKEMLPFLMGIKNLTDEFVKNSSEDQLNALRALGLIKSIKNGNIILPTKNMVKTDHENFFDFKNEIPKWVSTDFEIELEQLGLESYSMIKCCGDDYAVILNSVDETVLYVKYFQDSRCPWIRIDGDERRTILGGSLFHPPTENGYSYRIEGWTKIKRGQHSSIEYKDTNLKVSDFIMCIIPYIRKNILNTNEDNRKPNSYEFGLRERRIFSKLSSIQDVYTETFDGTPLNIGIEKGVNRFDGIIVVNNENIGTIELIPTTTLFKFNIKLTSSLNYVDVFNGTNECFLKYVNTNNGKKQFQLA